MRVSAASIQRWTSHSATQTTTDGTFDGAPAGMEQGFGGNFVELESYGSGNAAVGFGSFSSDKNFVRATGNPE